MKKILLPEIRLCRNCKHIELVNSGFLRCRLYQPEWAGDELLVSKSDKFTNINCPLVKLRFNGLGHRYIRRNIEL
ncbi:MAG: hypothetical protein VB119_09870 [Candidatus Metalachnospira sp.]|nr:hypothetical protein [Candidatus Metalachnospira sp.]